MRSFVALPAAMLLAALPSACGDADARADARAEPVVRDSAGITIVENTDPLWTEADAWRLSDEPVLEIGMMDGPDEYQLHRANGALRLRDGRIVIANAGTRELRFYDDEGRHIRSVGGEGDGPGEFGSMGGLHRADGDSLLVYDGSNRRISLLDSDGEFGRTLTIEPRGWEGFPRFQGRFSDGTLLASFGSLTGGSGPPVPGPGRDTLTYVRFSESMEVSDTLGPFAANEWFVVQEGDRFMFTSPLFARSGRLALDGDALYYGSTDRYSIGRFTPGGDLERLIRRDFPARPVTGEEIAQARQRRLDNVPEGAPAQRVRELTEAIPAPETMPAHSEIEPDDDGNLWVREYPASSDEPPRWTVFDADGRMLVEVGMPADFAVRHIGADFVLGVYRDDFDVEYVRMYELIKPEAAS